MRFIISLLCLQILLKQASCFGQSDTLQVSGASQITIDGIYKISYIDGSFEAGTIMNGVREAVWLHVIDTSSKMRYSYKNGLCVLAEEYYMSMGGFLVRRQLSAKRRFVTEYQYKTNNALASVSFFSGFKEGDLDTVRLFMGEQLYDIHYQGRLKYERYAVNASRSKPYLEFERYFDKYGNLYYEKVYRLKRNNKELKLAISASGKIEVGTEALRQKYFSLKPETRR
jgi:hypothetical protein